MRAVPIALLLLAFCSPARAGIYVLDESVESSKLPLYFELPDRIFNLRGATMKPVGNLDAESPRAKYQRLVGQLEEQRYEGLLSPTDTARLASCYLRLGEVKTALGLLRSADQSHFLVQAVLAAGYQMIGELELAQRHQQRALDLWPDQTPYWRHLEMENYKEAEQYNLRLITSRLDESRRSSRPDATPTIDPLFPGVQFVNDKGRFEAGAVSRKSFAKLPKNAGEIVLQLVLWQPFDPRLNWLLADILNGHGKVQPASRLILSLVSPEGFKLTWPELRERHKALQPANKFMDTLEGLPHEWPAPGQPLLTKWYFALSEMMLVPRGFIGAPVIGDAAYYSASLALPVAVGPEHDKMQLPPEPPAPVMVAPTLPFNLKHAAVSFVFGLLTATLIALQWREWRRRRAAMSVEQDNPEGYVRPAPPS